MSITCLSFEITPLKKLVDGVIYMKMAITSLFFET
jgi:hypothetical protein